MILRLGCRLCCVCVPQSGSSCVDSRKIIASQSPSEEWHEEAVETCQMHGAPRCHCTACFCDRPAQVGDDSCDCWLFSPIRWYGRLPLTVGPPGGGGFQQERHRGLGGPQRKRRDGRPRAPFRLARLQGAREEPGLPEACRRLRTRPQLRLQPGFREGPSRSRVRGRKLR